MNEQTAGKFRALSHPALLALLLAAATLAVFWPVVHCNFLNYDDPDYFTARPRRPRPTFWTILDLRWRQKNNSSKPSRILRRR
ncbi:MAG: hypothetical protein ABSE90_00855 [Verrucomicrobiota bacterium]